MEETNKQHKNNFDWLKEYQWQKGQSGNPKGRPKEKTMKEWAREYISNMSEEARLEFMKNIDPDFVWRMAEGNPHQDNNLIGTQTVKHYIITRGDELDNKPNATSTDENRPVSWTDNSLAQEDSKRLES